MTGHTYTVGPLWERDITTLEWLNDRGYAGNILSPGSCTCVFDDKTGTYTLHLTEPQAWEFNRYVDEDPDAFLTCNGSITLEDALRGLLEKIV